MSMDNSRPAKRMMSTISKHSEEAEEDEIRSGNLCEINEWRRKCRQRHTIGALWLARKKLRAKEQERLWGEVDDGNICDESEEEM